MEISSSLVPQELHHVACKNRHRYTREFEGEPRTEDSIPDVKNTNMGGITEQPTRNQHKSQMYEQHMPSTFSL